MKAPSVDTVRNRVRSALEDHWKMSGVQSRLYVDGLVLELDGDEPAIKTFDRLSRHTIDDLGLRQEYEDFIVRTGKPKPNRENPIPLLLQDVVGYWYRKGGSQLSRSSAETLRYWQGKLESTSSVLKSIDIAAARVPAAGTARFRYLTGIKRLGEPRAAVECDPLDLLRFVQGNFAPLNMMMERAGMGEADIFARTRDLFRYFDLPFDPAGGE